MSKIDLPRYKCHKEVYAGVIESVRTVVETDKDGRQIVVGGVLTICDAGTANVSGEYILKHKPRPGGYYVLYDDGYESFSPAQVFEDGYALLPVSKTLEDAYDVVERARDEESNDE